MIYIKTIHFNTDLTHPFPYDVSSIKHSKNIELDSDITFFIGDNGTGKSTLIETLAFWLQLPHMDGYEYSKKAFEASTELVKCLDIEFNIDRPTGFFFRAEDFGELMNSIDRRDADVYKHLKSLEGEVPESVIKQMMNNANYQQHRIRNNYGQDLLSFSHGEAYLKILHSKINRDGIYILDEPEAALSPARQLSLIYLIMEHLKDHQSQFIISTHSPMLMAIPGASLYEISHDGMEKKPFEETEHYTITRNFLNNPETYLRHL